MRRPPTADVNSSITISGGKPSASSRSRVMPCSRSASRSHRPPSIQSSVGLMSHDLTVPSRSATASSIGVTSNSRHTAGFEVPHDYVVRQLHRRFAFGRALRFLLDFGAP
jgi:hypothetical protein